MPNSLSDQSSSSSAFSSTSVVSKTKLKILQGESYFNQKNGDRYYKYGIQIRTVHPCFTLRSSLVRRRYSEFCWLRKHLKDIFYIYDVFVPELPSKGLFQNREDSKFLEQRRLGLEKFLLEVLSISLFTGDRGLHLFLQTSLTVEDIKYNLNGSQYDHIILIKMRTPIIDNTPSAAQTIPCCVNSEKPKEKDVGPIACSVDSEDQKENDTVSLSSLSLSLSPTEYSSTPKYSSILKAESSFENSLGKCTRRVSFNRLVRVLTVSSAIPVKSFEN